MASNKPGSTALGLEASAIDILKRAVELDSEKRNTEALVCYQEGLKLLLDAVKCELYFWMVKGYFAVAMLNVFFSICFSEQPS